MRPLLLSYIIVIELAQGPFIPIELLIRIIPARAKELFCIVYTLNLLVLAEIIIIPKSVKLSVFSLYASAHYCGH